MWQWYEGRVTRIEQAAPDTRRFWIEVVDVPNFAYQAGQFVTLDLPISAKRLQRWRSYSIASAPDGGNEFELCVVRLEGGLGTAYLFEEVTVGSVLKFKGADGTFVLPEQLDNEIVMICTGTGIAPFRAMLGDIFAQAKPHQNLHLIFGTRYATGILYQDELKKLQAAHPDFRYDIALSREKLPDTTFGYVHQIYQKNINLIAHYYLCGWKNMVDEAVKNLTDAGVPQTHIHYEVYG
jgi:ferredoxin-NADP reductase